MQNLLLFLIIVFSLKSCKSIEIIEFSDLNQKEQISIDLKNQTFHYSAHNSFDTLSCEGQVKLNDSIIRLIFPVDFERIALSPFPKNEIKIDSILNNSSSREKLNIVLKVLGSNEPVIGCGISLFHNEISIGSYVTDFDGKVQIGTTEKIKKLYINCLGHIQEYINLTSNMDYNIELNLAEEQSIEAYRMGTDGCRYVKSNPEYVLVKNDKNEYILKSKYQTKVYSIKKHKT